MPHPLLRVGIILVVALTDILVYLYDTGRLDQARPG